MTGLFRTLPAVLVPPIWAALTLAGALTADLQAAEPAVNPAVATEAATPDRAAWLQRLARKEAWLYNPRERTRAAMQALEVERPEEAIAAASLARELEPGDHGTEFNAGTVSLLGGDAAGAAETLAPLADGASEDPSRVPLAVDSAYNLGNAHYQQQQFDQAIDWYRETLRRDPSRLDAKINLELALRNQQQQQQRQQQQGGQDGEQDQQQPVSEEQQSESPSGTGSDQDPAEETGEQAQPEDQPGEQQSPLPRFEPRPDMTAEQAASLLEAVEAMEREARAEMRPESRTTAPGNRDW